MVRGETLLALIARGGSINDGRGGGGLSCFRVVPTLNFGFLACAPGSSSSSGCPAGTFPCAPAVAVLLDADDERGRRVVILMCAGRGPSWAPLLMVWLFHLLDTGECAAGHRGGTQPALAWSRSLAAATGPKIPESKRPSSADRPRDGRANPQDPYNAPWSGGGNGHPLFLENVWALAVRLRLPSIHGRNLFLFLSVNYAHESGTRLFAHDTVNGWNVFPFVRSAVACFSGGFPVPPDRPAER